MADRGGLSISKTARGALPQVPYQTLKDNVLGGRFALSLVLVGEARARAVNKQTRNKTYAPNVLAFLLGKNEGEIYICPQVAKRQAPRFGMSYRKFLAYLFIHGMLHLKGMEHGDTMERTEERALRAIGW